MTDARRGWILLLGVAGVSMVLDQGTKLWVEMDLKDRPEQRITVIGGCSDGCLNFRYTRNTGAAFSFLAKQGPGFRRVFFVGVSLAAIGLMLYLYRRAGQRRPMFEWALGLLIGGAGGNLIDRVRFNEVVDFVDVYVGGLTAGGRWPTFNVADMAIVAGIGLVLLDAWLRRPRKEKAAGPGRRSGRGR